MFQSQPKVVQPKVAEKGQQKDLKTSLMQAERYGHQPSQVNFSNQSASTGQPVQCAKGFFGSFSSLFGKKKRPPKPQNAGMTNQKHSSYQAGKDNLTAHHKYPYSQIQQDFQKNNILNNPNSQGAKNYQNWADPKSSKQKVNESDVAWAPHNIFMGPKGEHRIDDPGKFPHAPQVDTHFTPKGSVTPNSKVALHAYKNGLAHFNPADLTNKLQSLVNTNKASQFNPAEWTKVGANKKNESLYKQTGMPADWHKWSIDDRIKYAK
ncbi:hypothetical protein DSM106972_097970 [Dulcicalothrix desertica PCC 7102]|uniref:Uncharacterized protein n=2 Tax=Dulcicalothrix desertica TaxID=32056 RepID=A0A3S1A3R4_9CYAN|nr:hypothetical protein DSM106972_097970 [Dulcicalothrix desertica PCC 7102]